MPAYDFKCGGCGNEFTVIMSIKEREGQETTCPKCSTKTVEALMVPFFAKTSKKS